METFRALLVVDAEKFSAHSDVKLPRLHMEIRRVLAAAFEESGLGDTWKAVRFLESTGDGILAILPHDAVPRLVEPFPRRLQDELAASAPGLRAEGMRLRLRVAMHIGLVDDERPDAPGVSTATVDVNRLVEGEPLRDALKRSDPEVTFAAFLFSSELFSVYVAGGRTGLRESQFTEVEIKVKQFVRPAHLYVPVPSRRSEPEEGGGAAKPAPVPPAPGGPSIGGITISGDGTQNAFGNTVGGDFRQER
ncbi:hypothetical protein [Actinomadura rubrisoli]|uniref:Guanylate cyclase domain-containing protein n=1 Tax=Actinomadura rubrisoli TaxID=2530368 RepID=A0A4R5AII5_9ACTN|nr:hypothetical protein [Actinomadura rubrisoli]TDD71179.1 hypothetical protein E1298_35980 [Actinomadura rubrisoli]